MSNQIGPVTGTLSAVSGSALSPAQGSVVQFPTNLRNVEQQCLVVISGARTGLQIVVEAQDAGALAPFYGVRAIPQATGQLVAGGVVIPIADDPSGTNAAIAVVAAIEGAGQVRVRCVGLTSGAPAVLMGVGSFFGAPPVSPALTGPFSAPALLKTLRAVERLLSLQSGAWVGVGTDDGAGNTVFVDPSLGDTVG